MKLLWVNNIFLHPTNKGGQIRTLEMLRCLSRRHEIHYVAYDNPRSPEGFARAGEYSSKAFACPSPLTRRFSAKFFVEAGRNLFSRVPVLLERRRSYEMGALLERLTTQETFDCKVCDFLTPSINIPRIEDWIVFQHNVETMIFRRYAETASDPLRRWYFRAQAARLFEYERDICRRARHVAAVSESDADTMRREFGAERVTAIPTGVNLEYFRSPDVRPPGSDLVFVGSMDWLPNIDGVLYFVNDILPLIRQARPDTTLTIVGRDPTPAIRALAERFPGIIITGTVPDVRPFLWGAKASIVPLRIGGGTRLKIYESMAAGTPTVSTTIGAEGLEVRPGDDISFADTPAAFAASCLDLLQHEDRRARMATAGRRLVEERFSWETVASRFEALL